MKKRQFLQLLGLALGLGILIVQFTYFSVNSNSLPIFSVSSQSALSGTQEGGLKRQTGGGEDGPAAVTAYAEKLAVNFLCKDLQMRGRQCNNALFQGKCHGVTLLSCLDTCQQCKGLPEVITKSIGLDVSPVQSLSCSDSWHRCAGLVTDGHCHTLPLRVLLNCKASCGLCTPGDAQDIQDAPGLTPGCVDLIDVCGWMVQQDMCGRSDMPWVQAVCSRSCGLCGPTTASSHLPHRLAELKDPLQDSDCIDLHSECSVWSQHNGCSANTDFMKLHCRRACNQCSSTGQMTAYSKSAHTGGWQVGTDLSGSWRFSSGVWSLSKEPVSTASSVACADKSSSCPAWAAAGECTKNPSFMNVQCKTACGVCSGTGPIWYLPEALNQVMLNNGVLMPVIGFGTAGLSDGTATAVEAALRQGYRHLDSAQAREWYREDLVGAGLKASGVPRQQVFITTKIHPRHLGFETTLAAFASSLADLQTDYVDLVLLHYPVCWGNLCDPAPHDPLAGQYATLDQGKTKTWRDSWQALEQLYQLNKTRAIGVSNFQAVELAELYSTAKFKPQVLQVHMDPLSQSAELRETCLRLGIQMAAFSSLGTQWPTQGPDHHNPVLHNKAIQAIADATQKSVAQVVLRWVLHMGVIALPRSTNPAHMQASLDVLKFNLDDAQIRGMMLLDGSGPPLTAS